MLRRCREALRLAAMVTTRPIVRALVWEGKGAAVARATARVETQATGAEADSQAVQVVAAAPPQEVAVVVMVAKLQAASWPS